MAVVETPLALVAASFAASKYSVGTYIAYYDLELTRATNNLLV